MADEARSRLGRGLASLIGDVGGEAAHVDRPSKAAPRKVPIEFLKANPKNPRRSFSDAELAELADSIRQHGVIQPIVVRPVKGATDRFEIIAGERRWRASQKAGLHDVPIVTIDVTDSAALEIAIIENVQRSDLNAMEEAQGYHALAAEYKHSQDEIAKLVGKSRSHVANMMRLTKLPNEVQRFIADGKLSAGHARALIGVPDAAAAAKKIVEQGLNVRQAEALAHEEGVPQRKPQKSRGGSAAAKKDPDTIALEKRVSDVLGLKVSVEHRNPGGAVQIKYRDLDQLDDILRRLESRRK
ncbi:MAG: ParB/RepB/Spo0J family partition protein [Afipia sp.]|nr:ParB/RepB/Spo0J family partition protein [Afipia sp.]